MIEIDMKFNLVKKTSTRTSTRTLDAIIENLISEFCKDHDIIATYTVKKFLGDYKTGLPSVIAWASHQGWTVSMWTLPDDYVNSNGPLAYGLDFDDNCPYFMEARLKYS